MKQVNLCMYIISEESKKKKKNSSFKKISDINYCISTPFY